MRTVADLLSLAIAAAAGMLFAGLLSACDQGQGTADDGYRFEKQTWEKTEYLTRNVLYPSIEAVQRAAPPEKQLEARLSGIPLAAWGRLIPDASAPGGLICEKHIVDPAIRYMPSQIGHEDVHCMKGEWHS